MRKLLGVDGSHCGCVPLWAEMCCGCPLLPHRRSWAPATRAWPTAWTRCSRRWQTCGWRGWTRNATWPRCVLECTPNHGDTASDPRSPQLADAVHAVTATMRRAHGYDGLSSFGHLAYAAPPRHTLDPLSAELATAESLAARLRRKGLASTQQRRATSPSVVARAGGVAGRRPTM